MKLGKHIIDFCDARLLPSFRATTIQQTETLVSLRRCGGFLFLSTYFGMAHDHRLQSVIKGAALVQYGTSRGANRVALDKTDPLPTNSWSGHHFLPTTFKQKRLGPSLDRGVSRFRLQLDRAFLSLESVTKNEGWAHNIPFLTNNASRTRSNGSQDLMVHGIT